MRPEAAPQTVLLVDPDPLVAGAVRDVMELGGAAVELVASAAAALARLGAPPNGRDPLGIPSVVVFSPRICDLSHAEFLACIRRWSPRTPVVALVAYGSVAQCLQLLRLGAADYILVAIDDVAGLRRRLRDARPPTSERLAELAAVVQEELPYGPREAIESLRRGLTARRR